MVTKPNSANEPKALHTNDLVELRTQQGDGGALNLGPAALQRLGKTGIHAGLVGAKLAGADLTGGDFSEADFSEANLTGAQLVNAMLSNAKFIKASLAGADLRGIYAIGAYFTGANLTRTGANQTPADMSGSHCQSAHFDGAKMAGSILDKSFFASANLDKADLSYASVRSVNFKNASLMRTNFTGADLRAHPDSRTNPELRETNPAEAAFINGADFTGAIFSSQAQVNALYQKVKDSKGKITITIDKNPIIVTDLEADISKYRPSATVPAATPRTVAKPVVSTAGASATRFMMAPGRILGGAGGGGN